MRMLICDRCDEKNLRTVFNINFIIYDHEDNVSLSKELCSFHDLCEKCLKDVKNKLDELERNINGF